MPTGRSVMPDWHPLHAIHPTGLTGGIWAGASVTAVGASVTAAGASVAAAGASVAAAGASVTAARASVTAAGASVAADGASVAAAGACVAAAGACVAAAEACVAAAGASVAAALASVAAVGANVVAVGAIVSRPVTKVLLYKLQPKWALLQESKPSYISCEISFLSSTQAMWRPPYMKTRNNITSLNLDVFQYNNGLDSYNKIF